MNRTRLRTNENASIRDLFPDLEKEKLQEAEEVMLDYLAFVVHMYDMYDRIRADPEAYARFQFLTADRHTRTMEGKGRFLTHHDFPNL